MSFSCFKLFDKKEPLPIDKCLGGPRSFYKFRYKNAQLILMGEVHHNISEALVSKYADVINQFIENNHSIKLFLEQRNDDKREREEKTPSDGMLFLDYMESLSNSSHLEIINADDREWNNGLDGLEAFLRGMEALQKGIVNIYKEKNLTPPSQIPYYSEIPWFVEKMQWMDDHADKSYTFLDLFKLLTSSMEILDKLYDKYSKINMALGDYIADCIRNINKALSGALEFQEVYRSLEQNKQKDAKEIGKTSVIKACMELMQNEKTCVFAEVLFKIYMTYVHEFLNGTLICKLWDALNDDDNEKTLMVVTGDAHTRDLADVFKKLCTPVISMDADPKGSAISPKRLNEFLHDNFEDAPKRNNMCAIL